MSDELLANVEAERRDIAAARYYQEHPNTIKPATFYADAPPAKLTEREAYLSGLLIRAGVAEPTPPSPQQRAEADFNSHYPDYAESEVNPLMDAEIARLNSLTPGERTAMSEALRASLGAEEYDRLVADAKLAPGNKWTDAHGASAPVLKVTAAAGRYHVRKEAARSRITGGVE